MDLVEALQGDRNFFANLLLTGLLLLVVVAIRAIVLSAVKRRELPITEMRKWTANTRTVTALVFLLLAAPLWFEPLKTLALSLVAVAAAIVLATKELIMCMSGALLRSTAKSFEIGDRIEINGVRGDVIDTNLFTTTVLEIGPGDLSHQQTGRAIVLPNGAFLSSPVVNETFTEAFVLHTFQVPVKMQPGWEKAEAALRRAVEEECAVWLEEARRHFDRMSRERGFEPPIVDPRVTLQLNDPDKITLVARLPVPARRKGRVEQEILRRFLSEVTGSPFTPAPAPTSSSAAE